jgi:hypothetical protein
MCQECLAGRKWSCSDDAAISAAFNLDRTLSGERRI